MSSEFRPTAPSADAVFYRTYSRRKVDGSRENFQEAMLRTVDDIAQIGKYAEDEYALVREQALAQRAFPSGRAFWVAGSRWSQDQRNFSGYYNCTSTDISDLKAFGLLVDLAMQGSGTGAVLEYESIKNLPPVRNRIEIMPETKQPEGGGGNPVTNVLDYGNYCVLQVGDSRQGWVDAYQGLINAAFSEERFDNDTVLVELDLSNVRASGERLKGFGGTANPIKLEQMFRKVADLLNSAQGRHLTTVEACLLIDEAAACIVAGNIRRSAGMRQFSETDSEAATAKLGLYSQDENGNWRVDPKKEALRMANHTICYHTKPSLDVVKASVLKQFESGEGAIQYVPEALARANVDLLDTRSKRDHFIAKYTLKGKAEAAGYLRNLSAEVMEDRELEHRMTRYGLNPCGEIIGRDFHCNLAEVHLNTLDPNNYDELHDAFYAAGLQVAALLQHEFVHERYQYSREIDPIVGVSFTGLFDFFVHALGYGWLEWMMDGRPLEQQGSRYDVYTSAEADYLRRFRESARAGVQDYCKKHGIRTPNRITTVQPAGTKSLLTGASSGWHPPKAQRFIRRITFGVNDPLVAALRDWGYNVIPAQSARDDEGNLLDDINDPRVHEVLVEIPTEVSWANIPGVDKFDLSQLSAKAQFGLYHQVQEYYTDHNTSATIEFRADEIDELSELIYTHMDKGYISAALLARFDANATFPRLPFEPIDKKTYQRLRTAVEMHRLPEDEELGFLGVLAKYDRADYELTTETACTSAACVAKTDKDQMEGKA